MYERGTDILGRSILVVTCNIKSRFPLKKKKGPVSGDAVVVLASTGEPGIWAAGPVIGMRRRELLSVAVDR